MRLTPRRLWRALRRRLFDLTRRMLFRIAERFGINNVLAYAQLAAELRRQNSTLAEMQPYITMATHYFEQSKGLPFIENPPFGLMRDPRAGVVYGYDGLSDEHSVGPGRERDAYRSFADLFRGSEERVKEGQRCYLDFIEDSQPVLDVGCGRGEFLDLLRERGLDAVGIDSDPGMVEYVQQKGHTQIKQSDANDYLATCEDRTFGVVFCAQVIEHMPPAGLQRFLRLCRTKLKPGGLLIAETVNPHSLHALKLFWVDPTHQHPLFPEVMLALCLDSGFESAFVFHPNGVDDVERDRYEQPAYAVIAERTASGDQ